MKLTLRLFITLILFAAGATALTAAKNGADIKFENTVHDFGIIHESKGKVTCTFKFTNTGTDPLIILSASATCGCTKPKYPTEPIAPGESGEISVTYNPAHRQGEITSVVKVKTNSKKNKKVMLKLTGNVVQ